MKARGNEEAGRAELRLALSPYHLTTRESPAMLALALGTSVVTLLPKPATGDSRESVREAVERAPRYLRMMESWRWSGPMWDAGVVSSAADEEDSAEELAGVYASIRSEEGLTSLRPLTRSADERSAEPFRALDTVAGDVLRGGPDPGINIPITAALDRFALRHGLTVVRGATASVTQRAEARLGRRVCAFAAPMLVRAGGARMLRMRTELGGVLDPLRRALSEVGREACAVEGGGAEAAGEVAGAAERYAREFEEWAREGTRGDDENDQRVVAGYLGVSAMVMPADAALRSSRAAVRSMGGGGVEGAGEACEERLFALVVREMNVRPEGAKQKGEEVTRHGG